MEGESIEGNSLAADTPECLSQRMEGESIEGNSLAADMPELNKSTKVAQKVYPENKNKEVAKPELESQEEDTCQYLKLADVHPDDFFAIPSISFLYPLNLLGDNDSD